MLNAKQWLAGLALVAAAGVVTNVTAENMQNKSLSDWVTKEGTITLPEEHDTFGQLVCARGRCSGFS